MTIVAVLGALVLIVLVRDHLRDRRLNEQLLRTRQRVEDVATATKALAPTPTTAELLPPDPLAGLLAHRYVVTLPDEAAFSGVLTDTTPLELSRARPEIVFTFEQCSTLPKSDGDTPETIAGRVILWSSGIAYLQQIS